MLIIWIKPSEVLQNSSFWIVWWWWALLYINNPWVSVFLSSSPSGRFKESQKCYLWLPGHQKPLPDTEHRALQDNIEGKCWLSKGRWTISQFTSPLYSSATFLLVSPGRGVRLDLARSILQQACAQTDKRVKGRESRVCALSLQRWLFISLLPQSTKGIY